MTIEVRNPIHNAVGSIDCELNHATFGWIPYTATPDDDQALGREVYAALVAGEFGPIAECPASVPDLKAQREAAVAAIKVTVDGFTYDGDEVSQGRMARAILRLQDQPANTTVPWVLSDNRVIPVTAATLSRALALAGRRQDELWVAA